MEDAHICYNCFIQLEDSTGPCPNCGFDLEENIRKYPIALRMGTRLNDRYLLGRVLGQGGFGITYLAFDTQLQAKVAVKEFMPGEIATRVEGHTVSVLSADRTEDFSYGSERFLEEARTLAKFMGNPNIAGVSNYFNENDTSYFVMDYIEGVSFKSYIANNGGKVGVEDALNVMIPTLHALTAVHREGFIHRDVTPDNIYITSDGLVKLLDFGSARYSIGNKSKSLDVILKVGYAPKEQYIRRGKQGPYTDVYSCAACFYSAITGFLPPESLERLDQDTLVPPSEQGIAIPKYLEHAILKGLAIQAEDRFQSAEEFLHAIEHQIVVETVPTRSAAGRAEEPAARGAGKRSLKQIAGIAAACVAVVIGVAIGAVALSGGGFLGSEPVQAAVETESLMQAEVPSITIAGAEYSTDLTKLSLSNLGLNDADLAPLKYMVNLKSLELNGNQITDLSPLAGLINLESIYLGGDLTDLTPLAGLTNLTYLNFYMDGGMENGNLSDLSPLAGLTKLQTLILPGYAPIKDLSPLSGMTELTRLSMHSSGNQGGYVEDLSPLSGMTKLTRLDLIVGNCTDLSPLSNMTQLNRLQIYGSPLFESLAPLSGMTELIELHIQDRNVRLSLSDLSALSAMTKLQILRMSITDLEDLSGLANLTELRSIDLNGDNALYKNLDALSGLTQLQELQLPILAQGSQPLDIQGLAGLTALQSLRLDHNVQDLSPLSGLTQLKSLFISDGYGGGQKAIYTSLEPLRGLINLTDLDLRSHNTDDLAPLGDLVNLRTISLSMRNVRNLSPLANLPQLRSLSIWESNNIKDWSPVAHVPNVTKS